MRTIQDRGYVEKRGQALIPSFIAFAVIGLLEGHYPRLVDYNFTAAMENQLDEIAGGDHAALDFLTSFYFGSDVGGDDSLARAEVVAGLVAEIVEAVRWRRAGEAGSDEIASLERLAAEAQAHRDRMRGAARTLGG